MTVADRIKETRIEKQMSQLDLAKKCGYSDRTSISKIESSGNDITMKKIARVAEALGVTTAYLMGWGDSQERAKQALVDHALYKRDSTEADIIVELYNKADIETQRQIKRILNYEETILKALRGK